MNELFEQLRRTGLLPELPKRSGLEIARDALAQSHPNSPQLPYLDRMILKAQTLNTSLNKERNNTMSTEDTEVEATPKEDEVKPVPTEIPLV